MCDNLVKQDVTCLFWIPEWLQQLSTKRAHYYHVQFVIYQYFRPNAVHLGLSCQSLPSYEKTDLRTYTLSFILLCFILPLHNDEHRSRFYLVCFPPLGPAAIFNEMHIQLIADRYSFQILLKNEQHVLCHSHFDLLSIDCL